MKNLIIMNALSQVMKNERLATEISECKWLVAMPRKKSLSQSDRDFLSRFGIEDFLLYEYSLYEEKVWRSIARKVRKILPKEIDIDSYELHDSYIYECVEVEEPNDKYLQGISLGDTCLPTALQFK